MSPLDAAFHVAQDYPGGIEALAVRLGKRATSLRAELHPSPGVTAKLGLLTSIAITDFTGDPRIIAAINAECGFSPPLPLPQQEELADCTIKDLLTRAAELSRDVAKEFQDFHEEIASDEITQRDLAEFEASSLLVIADIARLVRAMRSKMEADRRSHVANVTALKKGA